MRAHPVRVERQAVASRAVVYEPPRKQNHIPLVEHEPFPCRWVKDAALGSVRTRVDVEFVPFGQSRERQETVIFVQVAVRRLVVRGGVRRVDGAALPQSRDRLYLQRRGILRGCKKRCKRVAYVVKVVAGPRVRVLAKASRNSVCPAVLGHGELLRFLVGNVPKLPGKIRAGEKVAPRINISAHAAADDDISFAFETGGLQCTPCVVGSRVKHLWYFSVLEISAHARWRLTLQQRE